MAIKLTIPQLEEYSCLTQWVDIGKGWQGEGS